MDNSSNRNMDAYRPKHDSIFLDADGLIHDDVSLNSVENKMRKSWYEAY